MSAVVLEVGPVYYDVQIDDEMRNTWKEEFGETIRQVMQIPRVFEIEPQLEMTLEGPFDEKEIPF